jgi:hypothetical protein
LYLLVKWGHPGSILPDVGTTWIVLEPTIVPETVLRCPNISNSLVVNSEGDMIVCPFQPEQMEVIGEITTRVLNVPEI